MEVNNDRRRADIMCGTVKIMSFLIKNPFSFFCYFSSPFSYTPIYSPQRLPLESPELDCFLVSQSSE
jgi:hypothetical protein